MASIDPYPGRSLWYLEHWGPPAVVRMEIMEDETTKLGVMVFAPRPAIGERPPREYYIYATNGMSERRMPCREHPHASPEFRIELIAYACHEAGWVSDLLLEMARYPFVHGSGFAIGHTLSVEPLARNLWSGYLLCHPRLESGGFSPLAIDIGIGGDRVFYAQVFGLVEEELPTAIELGGPDCEERHLPKSLPSETSFLDLQRRPWPAQWGA